MKLCFEQHLHQVDKAGIPYPFHPFHVAEAMTDEYSTCVALLHDIVEDTDTTLEQLRDLGFPEEIISAIKLMSHQESMPYFEYIEKVKENPIARKVKISDLQHNSDLSRFDEITQKDLDRVEKYKTALSMLI